MPQRTPRRRRVRRAVAIYLVPLKSALVEALRAHFNADFPDPDFANLWVSIEYPREKTNYPGIWVNYEDEEELVRAGIDQREIVYDSQGGTHAVTRWRFEGSVSFTCAALTSLERDRLADQMVAVIAFANVTSQVGGSIFRDKLDSNDFIAMNGNFDNIKMSGDGYSPGTPWGTDEIIYEKTLTINVIGEFVSDPTSNTLAQLSQVQVMGYRTGETAPGFPDIPPTDPPAPPWNPTVWT